MKALLITKTNKGIRRVLKAQNSRPADMVERTRCDVLDMAPHLPKHPANVIDLGCGSGRLSAGLHRAHPEWDAKFWLLDGKVPSGPLRTANTWGWGNYTEAGLRKKPLFYNDWRATKSLCDSNGLTNYEFVEITSDYTLSVIPVKADLLFANRSVGYHFPISLYVDLYPQMLKQGAVCIFTYREVTGPVPEMFQVVKCVKERYQGRELLITRFSHTEGAT